MKRTACELCATMFIVAASASGQSAAINGELTGTVVDPVGAAVVNATVRATNLGTGYVQTVTTSSSGLYRLVLLPLGRYALRVEANGLAHYEQSGITVAAGASPIVDVRMQVAAVTTEVTVASEAPIADPARTDQGNTVSPNAIRSLPLVSRNPFNFILQQPNVSGHPNTEFGVPRKVNANGFSGRINFLLDGGSNVQTDRAGIRLLPVSQTWVEEVQAVNNGFAPEFGNTVGTVFNTVTRSGTNDLHGEGAYLFRRTPMSARPALLPAGQPTPEVNVDSVFADAGGRLIKDRMFFFTGFERVNRDLPVPVTVSPGTLAQLGLPPAFADPIPFAQKVSFFIAKLDWQVSSSHRVSVRYNGHRNDSPFNSSIIGGQYLQDRTFEFADRSHGGAVQLVSIFSPRVVNELRFQVPFRSQAQNSFQATGTGPAISIPGVANFGNSLDVGFRFDEMTPELSENLGLNMDRHAFKFGGSIRSIRDTQVQPTAALYTFPTIVAYLAARDGINPRAYASFVQTVGDPSMRYNSFFAGMYAQDTWKPRGNVTLTYGIRYDVYRPPSADAASPFEYSKSFRTDRNNIAPRVGLAVSRGKTVLRASGGVFFDPFQTDLYRRALLNNGTPAYFAISATPQFPFAPAFPAVLPGIPPNLPSGIQDITTVNPDFATLYSVNSTLSITREFAPDLAFSATYLFTRGNRLPVFRNINLVPSGQALADGRPIFGSTRLFPGFGNILVAESVGQSVYSGLTLMVTRRFSSGFELFGTYTWSHAIDDAPEQNNIDSPSVLLSDPTNRHRDRGNSLSDRRHVFNGNLVYAPVFTSGRGMTRYLLNGNRIAVVARIQSGDVFNMGSNRILNGDASTASAFQRPLFIGRNTLRAPRTSEFSVRYSRFFPIGERMRLEFIAESTNVFNRTNVVGMNTTATVDPLGNVLASPTLAWTSALDQRLVQLGVRFSF